MPSIIEQNLTKLKPVDDVIIFWIDDHPIPENLHNELRKSVARVLYTVHSTDFYIYMDYVKNQLSPGTVVSLLVHCRFLDSLLNMCLPQIVAIYGLGNKYFLRWKNTKVREVFYDLNPKDIIKTLNDDFDAYFNRQWSMGVSIFQTSTEVQRSMGELSRQNAQFMWYQLLVKILTQMPPSGKSKDDMLQQSFLNYKENKTINDFKTYEEHMCELKRLYTPDDAIKWYTRNTFVYRLLNQACRTSDIDLIFSFRFLIRDVFLQLTELYTEQKDCFIPLTVYRGTTVSQEELDMLRRNVGNLISRHQFLSTSVMKKVSSIFVDDTSTVSNETVFLLEEIYIDTDRCNAVPFASIRRYSVIKDEDEILLSIGSVFRIKSAPEQQSGNVWTIHLELVDNDEDITEELHRYLKSNIEDEPNLLTLSNFLLWMGKYDKARHYCDIFLPQFSENDPDRSVIYTHISYICQKMGKFDEALQYLNQAVETLQTLPDHKWVKELSSAYNDRGLVHKCRGEFKDALNDMHKALEMRADQENLTESERKVLAVNRSHVHENLGILYKDNTEYDLAINHLEKTLDLRQKYLPKNHYLIAQTYNNLSLVYTAMCNLKMAIECINKAIEIQRQSLPENHAHLATMHQTLAQIQYQKGEYAEALRNWQYAYDMYQKIPYCDPLMVAASLSNIGTTLKAMGKYTEALPNFAKALDAQRRFAPNHPNMIKTLNNMGMIGHHVGDIEGSMNYFQEALRMSRDMFGETHENTAITYFGIGARLNVDQYELAMSYLNRALNIYVQFLHLPYHNNVINCYIHMGIMEREHGQFDDAYKHFNQAIKTFRLSLLPKKHPVATKIYMEMALMYQKEGHKDKALQTYEQAREHTPDDSHQLPKVRQAIEALRSIHIKTTDET